MSSSKFYSRLKITIFILLAGFLCGSCAKANLPRASTNVTNENAAYSFAQSPTFARQVGDSLTGNTASNQEIVAGEKIKLPYQTRARRKNIKLPDDCRRFPSRRDQQWQLQAACAETLDAVLPDLPDEGCQYETFQKAGGRFDDVVENNQTLTYSIQETDPENLEALAEKLGTTRGNIVVNNKFNDAGKLSVGQELKYQKARLEKSAASWFDDYDLGFYPLSANKYLVKVRCVLGAYNELNAYLLYDESAIPAKAEVLEFPSYEFTYEENAEAAKTVEKVSDATVGGRSFNPKTKELIVFVKARGIGDAGRYARYSLATGKPKLLEYRARFKWSGPEYTLSDVQRRPPQTWTKYYP